jgi:hypothetical protein
MVALLLACLKKSKALSKPKLREPVIALADRLQPRRSRGLRYVCALPFA